MPLIRVIDLETNGMEASDAVLEAGWCDLIPEGDAWLIDEPGGRLFGLDGPLKPDARAVHHITPEEIAGRAPFSAQALANEATAADAIILSAHAWHFEGQWLTPEVLGQLRPLCTWKAALRVWPDAPSHSNGALRYWLEDQGLITPAHHLTMPPHRATPDAYVTAHLLQALLAHQTARQMVAWTKEPALYPRCPIGEKQGFKGKPWSEVDGGFLYWITQQAGMEPDIKWCAGRELNRRQEVSPP